MTDKLKQFWRWLFPRKETAFFTWTAEEDCTVIEIRFGNPTVTSGGDSFEVKGK